MSPTTTSLPVQELATLLEKPESIYSLINALSSGMLIYDEHKKLILCNQAAEQITGFTSSQLSDFSYIASELRFFDEDRQSMNWFQLPCVQAYLQGIFSRDCVLGFSQASRSIVWVKGSVYPIYNEDNSRMRYVVLSFNDITDQKIAEEKLIQFSQDWHAVLNNSRSAVFLLDTSYRIKLVNSYARLLLRLGGKEQEKLEGASFLDVLLPERKAFVLDKLEKAMKGEPVEYESLFKKENGDDLWLYANYIPVKNERGEIKEICITLNNTTRIRKEAERNLAEHNRWKLALEGGKDGVWEYNFETQEAYYSPLYKEMLGYADEEFQNSFYEWAMRLHPEDKELIQQLDQQYLNGEIDHHAIEYRIKNKAEEYIWVLDRGMILEKDETGKPVRLIGTHNNITERKSIEAGLRQSEQRFSSFMANTPTMNWIIDEKGVFRYLNKQYMDAFQLSETAIGRPVYDFFPKHICESFIQNNELVWRTGEALETIEEGVGPDGNPEWYHIFKFPLANENGIKLLGGVALDITKKVLMERKLAEEEARNKREMIQAIMDAQENERKEIADELHDNVNQILSSAKLMLESASHKPVGEKYFVDKGLYFLNNAIQEIRKISHNLTPGLLRDISLDAAIDDLVRNINSTGKIAITYKKTGDYCATKVRPEIQLAVLRITQEQLNNILRHAQASIADVVLFITEDNIALTVEDNGRGFDPRSIKRGIGLNNIFNRAEYFGGKAELLSTIDNGCRLQINIPI